MLEKIKNNPILLFVVGFAVGFLIFKLFSGGNNDGNGILLDNGTGTESIGSRIQDVQGRQQEITSGIEHVEQRIGELQIEVARNGEAIGDCEQILARDRERGKTKAFAH